MLLPAHSVASSHAARNILGVCRPGADIIPSLDPHLKLQVYHFLVPQSVTITYIQPVCCHHKVVTRYQKASMALYTKLKTTAEGFVLATSPKTPGTNNPNPDLFLSYLTPDFSMSFGHKFFVSTRPPLQGTIDGPGFNAHQGGMATKLKTWEIVITSTCVDVKKCCVVVRADFHMHAQGSDEAVLNDIVFWIDLDERGEKVRRAIEFVDPVASAELAKRMGAGAMQ